MATSDLSIPTSPLQPKPKRERGDGSIYKRGRTWWIAFHLNSHLQRESAKTEDEQKALKILRARLKEVHAHELDPSKPFITQRDRRRTISDLLGALENDFKIRGVASKQALSNIKRAKADLGVVRAMALTADAVDEYIEQRLADGYAKASVNRVTQLVKQAYTLADLPVPKIRRLSEKGNERRGFFAESEIRGVIANLPEYLRDFVLFGYLTGMRRGEIASLEWADLDGDVLTLRGENAKTGEGRTIPLVGELAELIARRREARQINFKDIVTLSSFIFHSKGLPIREFRKSWRAACCAASVGKLVCPNCSADVDDKRNCTKCLVTWKREELSYVGRLFHDLRRSAVRDLVRAGVPETVAMSISGHRTRAIFDRYNISNTRDQREALNRRAEYLKSVRNEGVVAMAAD
jgi:integrase